LFVPVASRLLRKQCFETAKGFLIGGQSIQKVFSEQYPDMWMPAVNMIATFLYKAITDICDTKIERINTIVDFCTQVGNVGSQTHRAFGNMLHESLEYHITTVFRRAPAVPDIYKTNWSAYEQPDELQERITRNRESQIKKLEGDALDRVRGKNKFLRDNRTLNYYGFPAIQAGGFIPQQQIVPAPQEQLEIVPYQAPPLVFTPNQPKKRLQLTPLSSYPSSYLRSGGSGLNISTPFGSRGSKVKERSTSVPRISIGNFTSGNMPPELKKLGWTATLLNNYVDSQVASSSARTRAQKIALGNKIVTDLITNKVGLSTSPSSSTSNILPNIEAESESESEAV
jgi:hypothetical protein